MGLPAREGTPRERRLERLLLVDDSADLRDILARSLRGRGYDAVACATLEEAGRALEAGGYVGALVDLYFGPHPEGLDLLKEIRRRPATADMPVVSMSGSGEAELARCLRVGADVVLPKPFSLNDAVEALARARAKRGAPGGGRP